MSRNCKLQTTRDKDAKELQAYGDELKDKAGAYNIIGCLVIIRFMCL